MWRCLGAALVAIAVAGCGGGGHSATSSPKRAQVTKFSGTTAWPSRPGAAPKTTRPAAPAPAAVPPPEPSIVQRPIPFGTKRRQEMAAYAVRHYGRDTYRLISPHVIVEHYTETPTFSATYNTFAPDVPDTELHELPGTCAHFVIDRDGTIHQLVPLRLMCRHTVGLNWTAIGIEHVGLSDADVMGRRAELRASLRLTRRLQARFHIRTRDVIGHSESLSSPYHRERVRALRTQTHADMARATMRRYRRAL
jgi:N-acetylmuramoyl-L-alanine amidase